MVLCNTTQGTSLLSKKTCDHAAAHPIYRMFHVAILIASSTKEKCYNFIHMISVLDIVFTVMFYAMS
jgi:hypothetical protein